MVKTEEQVDTEALAVEFCDPVSSVITDSHVSYNTLGAYFDTHDVVNHGSEFQTADGKNTNMAESFFARLRQAQAGAWHRMSVQHLRLYGWDMAWRQAMVGAPNGEQMDDLLRRIFCSPR